VLQPGCHVFVLCCASIIFNTDTFGMSLLMSQSFCYEQTLASISLLVLLPEQITFVESSSIVRSNIVMLVVHKAT